MSATTVGSKVKDTAMHPCREQMPITNHDDSIGYCLAGGFTHVMHVRSRHRLLLGWGSINPAADLRCKESFDSGAA